MQNDFCHPNGWVASQGGNITYTKGVIKKIKLLIKWARQNKIPIIYTSLIIKKDGINAGLFLETRPIYRKGGIREGTWGAEIVDELTPSKNDYVIDKSRFSAFIGTNLELLLRGLKADTVLISGVATHLCVETTARDAMQRDFRVIFLKDCTGSYDLEFQRATERVIEAGFGKLAILEEVKKMF